MFRAIFAIVSSRPTSSPGGGLKLKKFSQMAADSKNQVSETSPAPEEVILMEGVPETAPAPSPVQQQVIIILHFVMNSFVFRSIICWH